ncbi:Auxin response factor 4 [Gossypium australe]|uniref:Auxin response factor 4 n=1 Tax=Gossypium australe TaxID=47621 RepID=A0A5B6WRB8_9ROSI|nr:Auxin response factor 4 [Gossypium australe]
MFDPDKQKRDEVDLINFLNLFKTLNVNLLLLELIDEILKYAKYLKEFMACYKKVKKGEQIDIDALCSTFIAKKKPPKLKDLGSFMIPIEIRDQYFNKALCDLGVSINLIPLSIYQKFTLEN